MLTLSMSARAYRMTIPADVPYGTLDAMVLTTVEAMGPRYGYGIARRIEQAAEGSLTLEGES